MGCMQPMDQVSYRKAEMMKFPHWNPLAIGEKPIIVRFH